MGDTSSTAVFVLLVPFILHVPLLLLLRNMQNECGVEQRRVHDARRGGVDDGAAVVRIRL